MDSWWADVFGIAGDEVWKALTVQPHAQLGDYAGFFVAWRADGVHVSTPTGIDAGLPSRIASASLDVLQSAAFWQSLADDLGGRLIGPATHHYLDLDPGSDPDVRIGEPSAALPLREHVTPEEWEESGLGADDVTVTFTLGPPDQPVAAAALSTWPDAARDVCVLVHPDHRGQGLVDRVARTATSYAIARHDVARWTARSENHASMQAARRLGFQAWCTQLAIRLPDPQD